MEVLALVGKDCYVTPTVSMPPQRSCFRPAASGDDKAQEMAAKEVGRIARQVGARSWPQLFPHLPEAEEPARRIQIWKGGEG
jgi:hypothetical protein